MLRAIIRSNSNALRFVEERRGDAPHAFPPHASYAVTVMLRVPGDDLEDVVGQCLSDTRCIGVRVQRLQRAEAPGTDECSLELLEAVRRL